jgi:hypothetical protein
MGDPAYHMAWAQMGKTASSAPVMFTWTNQALVKSGSECDGFQCLEGHEAKALMLIASHTGAESEGPGSLSSSLQGQHGHSRGTTLNYVVAWTWCCPFSSQIPFLHTVQELALEISPTVILSSNILYLHDSRARTVEKKNQLRCLGHRIMGKIFFSKCLLMV